MTLRSLRPAALAATVTLLIQVLFLLVIAFMAIRALTVAPSDPLGVMTLDETADETITWYDRTNYIFLVQIFFGYLAAAAAVMVWMWRAWNNAEAINESIHIPGGAVQRWGRPWTIAGWIVPLMNYWVPRQMVGDIWKAGAQDKGTGLINAWWTLWVLFNLAGFIDGFMAAPETVDSLSDLLWLSLAQSLIGIAAAILAILVIRRITQAHQAHVDHIARVLAEAESQRIS